MNAKKLTAIALLIIVSGLFQAVYATEPQPRIVGGKIAADHAYPFIVALEYSDGFAFCGGTLISPNKVLTAAHCADNTPTQIRAGTNNKALNPGQVVKVINKVIHPKYNNVTVDYDVAIFTLETPLTLNNAVNVIGLPEACSTLNCITGLAKAGTLVRVAGWGATHPSGNNSSQYLREVDVPIITNSVCNSAVGAVGNISSRMICAGLTDGGKDSCSGDSGGPLFAYIPGARAGLQAGIVSWGTGQCGQVGFYGVYTRISHPEIRAFIRQQAL
jgi:trypsin